MQLRYRHRPDAVFFHESCLERLTSFRFTVDEEDVLLRPAHTPEPIHKLAVIRVP